MHKRIKELAEQALNYAEKNQSADIPQHWFKLHTEKFAELIVGECMSNLYLHGYDDARQQIKQHFGIEE